VSLAHGRLHACGCPFSVSSPVCLLPAPLLSRANPLKDERTHCKDLRRVLRSMRV
jgi:hypothetical protein